MTADEFRAWLEAAAPGEHAVYETRDYRFPLLERSPVMAAAWDAFERGLVTLVQRRRSAPAGQFNLLAVRLTGGS